MFNVANRNQLLMYNELHKDQTGKINKYYNIYCG